MKQKVLVSNLRRCLLGGVALLAAPTAALAQDAAPPAQDAAARDAPSAQNRPGEATLDDIIVTAQRRSERLQSVPIAVTAFDETAIARMNSRDITALAGQVPNLTLSEVSIGPGLSQISIRGVNSQDPEKSFDPAVGVFIDGIYLGSSAFTLLNTDDIERIEVLRGPQGTLFGRNTTGGAINATRRRPSGELGFRGSVTLGNYGRNDYQGEANLPKIGNLLSVLLRGQYQKDDGMYPNAAGGATGAKDRWSAGVAVRLQDAGVADITLSYDHAEDDSELRPYVPMGIATVEPLPITITQTVFPTPATVIAGLAPDRFCVVQGKCLDAADPRTTVTDPHRLRARLDALTLNGDFTLSDQFTLTTVLGWRKSSEAVYVDFDGTEQTAFGVVRVADYSQYSGEVRLASSFGGPIDFVAGAFLFHSQYTLQQAIKLDLALVGVPVPFGQLYANGSGDRDDHEADTRALFAQADWKITDKLKLTLGGRGTWDRKQIFTQFFGAPLGPTAPYRTSDGVPPNRPVTSQGGANAHWFQFTPKAMLTYQPDTNALFYASYTRGYNAGGFSARAGTVADVTNPYDPEFVKAYEVGAKLDLLDRRLRINAAAFWNDYSDKQEDTFQPGPPPSFTSTTVRNAAAARLRGFELEISALPVNALRLDASFGYLDAKYTGFDTLISSGQYVSTPPQPTGTLIAVDLTSLNLRRAPELSGSAGATYSADLNFGKLQVNGQVRYIGTQYLDFFNSPRGRVEGYATVNASANISFGGPDQNRFQVTVFGENLTDKQVFDGFVDSLVDFGSVTRPRQYGVRLGVAF